MLRIRGGALSILGGNRLLGGRIRCDEPLFLCDLRSPESPGGPSPDDPPSSHQDSGHILASGFSHSGEYFALSDERKRLLLFRALPAWELLSVRRVSRRCTALTFSACESRVLLADKSGDVFSFSVTRVQEDGGPELGHLSMLLDLAVSRDGRHVISCDRDEKIRVSLWAAPHVISAFCLGHTEFVSQLLVLPGGLLVSGSGDGTLRLWRYESGRQIHSWDLSDTPRPGDDAEVKRLAVSRLSCSPDGDHLAVLCDGVSGVYLFSVCAGPLLAHTQYIRLPSTPLDMDFEDSNALWVLSGVKEKPIEVYRYTDGSWQPSPQDQYMKKLSRAIQEEWEQLEGSVSLGKFGGLYKALCDNMASYLMKKEARMQSEKRKLSSGAAASTAKLRKT